MIHVLQSIGWAIMAFCSMCFLVCVANEQFNCANRKEDLFICLLFAFGAFLVSL